MIVARNVSKTFSGGNTVLNKLSFQIDPGELIVVLGASGSGKTVLLRCIALQDRWTTGQYIVDGKDAGAMSFFQRFQLKRQMAMLSDQDLDPKLTALRNVLNGRMMHTGFWRLLPGFIKREERINGMDYLEKVGLLDRAHLKVELLSGGEKQRVAIAKALVRDVKLIAADEPVKGLAPDAAERVMADLQSLVKKENLSVICSLPQVELAEKYATRIWGLADKRIVLDIRGRRLTMREKQMIFG